MAAASMIQTVFISGTIAAASMIQTVSILSTTAIASKMQTIAEAGAIQCDNSVPTNKNLSI
eukprot:1158599-Pelagomonas_calceolata.AAC.4